MHTYRRMYACICIYVPLELMESAAEARFFKYSPFRFAVPVMYSEGFNVRLHLSFAYTYTYTSYKTCSAYVKKVQIG